MKERLFVYLRGSRIGFIEFDHDANSREFSYDAEYLASSGACPISLSLPLREKPFNSWETRLFFENLLPPVIVRRRLEKIIHHDADNYFAFLKTLGGDCAGAIALYPEDVDPSDREDVLRELSEDEADEIFKALPMSPLLQGVVDNYRISVAGAQDKLVVRLRDGRISLPLYGAASTHIVKPGMDRCEDSVENECFCQRLAAKVGLSAAGSSIFPVKGRRYYVTERYDRKVIGGRVERYLQEDFCQAMGVDSESKYQTDGGPSAARCFRFLREHSLGLADQMRFVDFFLYNFLIGNADAHAKNFSLLHVDGGSAVAPLYDAMSTLVYPNVYNAMAMEIGGHYEFRDVTRESFASFAEKCDINPRAVLDRLDALAERLPQKTRELAAEMSDEGHPSPIYARIGEVIREQVERVKGAE